MTVTPNTITQTNIVHVDDYDWKKSLTSQIIFNLNIQCISKTLSINILEKREKKHDLASKYIPLFFFETVNNGFSLSFLISTSYSYFLSEGMFL